MSIKHNLFDWFFIFITTVIATLGFYSFSTHRVQSHILTGASSIISSPDITNSIINSSSPLVSTFSANASANLPTSDLNFLVKTSTVNVTCGQNSGSGIIINQSGLILTSAHLIFLDPKTRAILNQPSSCTITIPDAQSGAPTTSYATITFPLTPANQEYDLAFLQIDTPEQTQFASILDGCFNRQPQLGQSLRLYGYPITSTNANLTVTEGVVSNFDDSGLIFTSAKIDHGNSGGLVVDENQCFLGLINGVISSELENLGTFIPLTLIDEFFQASQQTLLESHL